MVNNGLFGCASAIKTFCEWQGDLRCGCEVREHDDDVVNLQSINKLPL